MGGAMAQMSRVMPGRGYDFGGRVLSLPADGAVPGVPAWRWLHAPGHTRATSRSTALPTACSWLATSTQS